MQGFAVRFVVCLVVGLIAHRAWAEPSDVQADRGKPGVVREMSFATTPEGERVELYCLTNVHGLKARIMTLGATLVGVEVPDREGRFANVTLSLDELDDYMDGHPLFGSVVGRYANRIAGAKFTLDDVEYPVTPNAGENHIHGGRRGFHKLVWDANKITDDSTASIVFSHTSPDGTEGYPGTLEVTVTYSLSDENELVMRYTAKTDKPTVLNLTNHAYWNLAGIGSENVLGHQLELNADQYLPADAKRIPTGELKAVRNTVMDFTTPQLIGSRIDQVEGKNYDHCYVLNKHPGERRLFAAEVFEPTSGRVMEIWTTQPGVQFYTARGLNGRFKKGDVAFGPYQGFCLETQHYPDSPNRANFPSTVLRPGKTFEEITVHVFRIKKEVPR